MPSSGSRVQQPATLWNRCPSSSGSKPGLAFANARGINDDGVIVGWTHYGGQTVGFVGSASRGYQLLVPPGGEVSGALIYRQGINGARQVACVVQDADANPLGAVLGTPMGDEP
jgi:hypothetical protein